MGHDSGTMAQIQMLSNERQGLWRLAGKQKLNEGQRERLHDLHGIIARLWDTHRSEVAGRSYLVKKPEDFLYQEWAADFNDRQSLSGATKLKARLVGSEDSTGENVGLKQAQGLWKETAAEVDKHKLPLRTLLQMQKRYQDAKSPLGAMVQLS